MIHSLQSSSSTAVTMETVMYQPEHNPQAIVNYCLSSFQVGRSKNPDVQDMILKAKKHLAAVGWSFFYILKKPDRRELRYRSPNGKSYYSLRTACQSIVDHQGCYVDGQVLETKIKFKVGKQDNIDDSLGNNQPKKKIRLSDVDNVYDQQQGEECGVNLETKTEKIDDSSSYNNHDHNDNRPKKKIRMADVENSYFQQQTLIKPVNNGFGSGKQPWVIRFVTKKELEKSELKPKKQIRKVEGSTRGRGHKCVLALLIEKNIVSRGSSVSYRKKDGKVLAKGRINDEGIQCDCCNELFLLSRFEAHAGSTYHRPAANIFLEDGRSISDCQIQLQLETEIFTSTESVEVTETVTRNDDFCSFCNDGGDLVLCDSCTSSFHSTCIGMTTMPDSAYWFCPSCCCRICHEGQFSSLTKEENKDHACKVNCGQCERKFHIDCVTKLGFSVPNPDSGKWLCSERCERISSALNAISGQSIPLSSIGNLSWRLLKVDADVNDTKTYRKLKAALDVMHECFQPVKHQWSDNDLVEDLIFNRSSKRANFKGFYTAVLEIDDEMITVATLRVHGCKVAEIPLVATRFEHQGFGMCRVLMEEIQKKLREMGVERLVLPAVPEKISIWTGSFGFSVMTEVERKDLVEYKLLDFPGTIACHKLLE